MYNINRYIIKKIEDFEKLKGIWLKLENGNDMTVFQSLEWNRLLFLEWKQSKYKKLFSHIEVYTIENGNCRMLIPIIVQNVSTNLIWWMGRKKGIYILGEGSYSDYLNIVYDQFFEDMCAELLDRIRKDNPGKDIRLSNVREDSFLGKYLLPKYSATSNTVSVAVKILSDKELIDKSLSKHTRQNLRTSLNRMTKDNMQYEFVEFEGVIDVDVIENLISMHMDRIKTKNSSHGSFLHRVSMAAMTKSILKKEKKNNIIKASMHSMKNSFCLVIKLQGEYAGYIYGLKENNGIIRIMHNCVNEKYGFYSPMFRGIYDYIIKCSYSLAVKEIDFTRGDEDYKYKLGGYETNLYSFLL